MKVKFPVDFYTTIEKFVKEDNMTYLEALLQYAKNNNIEIEIIAHLVKHNQSLKTNLLSECEIFKLVS